MQNVLVKIVEILQRTTTPLKPTNNDALAPEIPVETAAPTRVRRQKTPTKVSFNLNHNIIHQSRLTQRIIASAAANITANSENNVVTLLRVKSRKISVPEH